MSEIQQGKNSNLHQAKREKNDEFYTQLPDIENELKHYKQHFKGKIVLCNCDDPYESNFFKYFILNFKKLELKKLIGMGYATSPIAGSQIPLLDIKDYSEPTNKSYKIEVSSLQDLGDSTVFDLENIKQLIRENKGNIKITPLRGNGERSAGDFRSAASIKALKEADIVITNPPFSLFREYVAQLMEYEKQFVILGNMNAITYKEIFPLVKEDRLWTGYGFNMSMIYKAPYTNNLEANRKFVKSKWYDPDENYIKVPAVCRYTNLEHKKRQEKLILYKQYTSEDYPKYDNYDAIEVSKVADIPYDYEWAMGVPITFLDKYNPDQFEIIKFRKGNDDNDLCVNWKCPYFRILIRKK